MHISKVNQRIGFGLASVAVLVTLPACDGDIGTKTRELHSEQARSTRQGPRGSGPGPVNAADPRHAITGEDLLNENCFLENVPIERRDVEIAVISDYSLNLYVIRNISRKTQSVRDAFDDIDIPDHFDEHVVSDCYLLNGGAFAVTNDCKSWRGTPRPYVSAFEFFLRGQQHSGNCLKANPSAQSAEIDRACDLRDDRGEFTLTGCQEYSPDRPDCLGRSAIYVKYDVMNSVWTNISDLGVDVTVFGDDESVSLTDKKLAGAWEFSHKYLIFVEEDIHKLDRKKLDFVKFPVNIRIAMCDI